MYRSPQPGAMQAYKSVNTYSGVESANPHRLIEMLLDGALGSIAAAKGHIERREIDLKVAAITKVLMIVDGLRASLDKKAGGELAQNLDDLYDYIQLQLTTANKQNDVKILDRVTSLLTEIKVGWDAIPQDMRSDRKSMPATAVA